MHRVDFQDVSQVYLLSHENEAGFYDNQIRKKFNCIFVLQHPLFKNCNQESYSLVNVVINFCLAHLYNWLIKMPPWIYFFVLGEFRLLSRKRPIRQLFFFFLVSLSQRTVGATTQVLFSTIYWWFLTVKTKDCANIITSCYAGSSFPFKGEVLTDERLSAEEDGN